MHEITALFKDKNLEYQSNRKDPKMLEKDHINAKEAQAILTKVK